MPDLFVERRDEHLRKTDAFLEEARNLFRDDLLYRSALADAVSAIKHCLQAYLWYRIGEMPASEQRQRWQEVALEGSMPQLLRACTEAGLRLGDVERAVRDLNDARNRRLHDQPQTPIAHDQAAAAVQSAIAIRERVKVEIGARTVGAAARSSATPAAAAARAPAAASVTARAPTPPPASDARPTDRAPEAAVANGNVAATPRHVLTRRWLVAALTVLALLLGVGVGSAFTYPLATGALPGWLGRGTTSARAPQPTRTPPPIGLAFAGDLIVAASACGAASATLTIHNTGAAVIGWMIGSPDAANPGFALAADPTSHATLAGRLDPGQSIALTVKGLQGAHAVVIADTGTGEVAFGEC
ncbi:MAG TPA: hypothetical protein VGR57_08425 [Ktedonobacterales bacterium]|nr:hypothetical protein [Ktedonobacterales bacterium]